MNDIAILGVITLIIAFLIISAIRRKGSGGGSGGPGINIDRTNNPDV